MSRFKGSLPECMEIFNDLVKDRYWTLTCDNEFKDGNMMTRIKIIVNNWQTINTIDFFMGYAKDIKKILREIMDSKRIKWRLVPSDDCHKALETMYARIRCALGDRVDWHKLCPEGGSITGDCADCVYEGDYHYDFNTGQCVNRYAEMQATKKAKKKAEKSFY